MHFLYTKMISSLALTNHISQPIRLTSERLFSSQRILRNIFKYKVHAACGFLAMNYESDIQSYEVGW